MAAVAAGQHNSAILWLFDLPDEIQHVTVPAGCSVAGSPVTGNGVRRLPYKVTVSAGRPVTGNGVRRPPRNM